MFPEVSEMAGVTRAEATEGIGGEGKQGRRGGKVAQHETLKGTIKRSSRI